MKIAETVKNEVEEFKPFVPLALALRTEGMKRDIGMLFLRRSASRLEPFRVSPLRIASRWSCTNSLTSALYLEKRLAKKTILS
jgi:hypothetical protein